MNTTDTLRAAHQELKKAVLPFRRKAHKVEGPIAATFRQAMVIWDQMKADGVSLKERAAGLAKTLRAVWPQTREWKYICQNCDDYGLEMGLHCPGDATCGRHREHPPHEFGRPCWCSVGNRFKEKAKPSAEDFREAGRSKGPARVGR